MALGFAGWAERASHRQGAFLGEQRRSVRVHTCCTLLVGRPGAWKWAGVAGPSRGPTPRQPLAAPPQLLQQCRLVERILTSWEENDRVQ